MDFTFQINSDIKFNHDEKLLAKADAFRPQLTRATVAGQRLVKLVDDPSKLEGVGTEEVGPITDLAKMKLTRGDQVIIDMGRHCVGSFTLHLEHVGSPMDSPLALKLNFAEMPNELRHRAADYDGWLAKSWIQEEFIHLDQLPADLNLHRRYAFRYVQLTVVDTSPKWQVVFSKPVATVSSAVDQPTIPAPPLADPELKKIYQVGVTTLHDCMQDVFEDGPKRDRRLWLGDLRLQALANYATFDNTALVKRCLYLFGAMTASDGRIVANVFTNQGYVPDDTFMYDYGLFFITTLTDLLAHEADPEVLADLYPIAKKQWQVMTQFITAAGEVQVPDDYTLFVDWSNDFDKTTAGQAITIYAVKKLIDLARLAKDPAVAEFEAVCDRLTHFALTSLYDQGKRLFVSGPQREVNIASQVWMVLAHVLDDRANHELMARTVKELFPVTGIATPYMYHHVDQALFEAGLTDEALKLMKDYWGKMIALGADTYWEAFEPAKPDYSPYGSPIVNSYCHAWSCTPVYLLKKYLG